MIVLDASAAVDALLRNRLGTLVLERISAETLIAPELLDVEVLSAFARLERADQLPDWDATSAVRRLGSLRIRRLSNRVLRQDAWTLRHRVRIADALYVACAQRLRVPLLTTDGKLARAALPGVSVLLVQ